MSRSKTAGVTRWACAFALLSLWGSAARAQERLSKRESMRSVVSPSLIWRFDAGASITTLPSSAAWVSLPHLGATVGVPGVGIPWRGLELSTSLVDFIVSPSPPAFGWVPQFALTQRLSPTPSYPVTAEVRDAFELALRLQLGVDPIMGKPFRVGGSIPLVFRAPDVLRIDLVPGIAYQAVYQRGLLDAPLRVLFQLADSFYFAAVSGVSMDLHASKSTTLPLMAQLGLTIPGDFGPLLDIIVDAGFPALFRPAAASDKVSTDAFRVMATFRFFTFWDLDATDPDQSSDAEGKRRRCGEIP